MTVSITIEPLERAYHLFTGRDACMDETRDGTPPSLVYVSTRQLQELSHKKLADLLRAAQRLAGDDQYGNCFGACQRNQFAFISAGPALGGNSNAQPGSDCGSNRRF
jgi:hypothetical protein